MANSLKEELLGKVVLIKAKGLKPEYAEEKARAFRVTDGFGAHSFTAGTALIGEFLADGEHCRMSGYDVERVLSDEEVRALGYQP